ncbi:MULTISPECIES: DNA-processing protein DprA [Mycobacteriaceae]|uniref:DNA-processing protein DprA n=1 Tax=Mycolicibacterium parafortuitum TaxID=39692 RepID=A0ACC6MH09_MYCPF|nr:MULTISPECIES: DNA-processing protein DprA [Mycobacteriaceae]MBX7454138.1 DNA-processing protein DprA [Mycolicibacterium aurantiacum]MEC9323003.1 DNA-processing protein DprA [Actinomycetota bacterium]MDZ5086152.1 DNA-processing protein DprA [Mycolicibacterium parafortuitum]GFM19298.1 DNA protecting protein DprA [Mycobacterium sp. PO1]GFM25458.1 DNA protecting protein DprA [Mycobacterium sp. PO2]
MDAVTRRAWAYLSRVAEPPNPLLAQLVSAVGAVEAADRIRRRHPHLGEHLARSTRARHELDCAEADLDILDRMGGRLVTVDDDEYPGLAFTAFPHVKVDDKRAQAHAPLVLWTVGPASMVDVAERSAALVGTRAASAYGEYVAGDLAVGLVERDVAVVSGGAYGIDGAAHRATLAADGVTVAVLACGVDVPYPSGHSALFHRISRSGLLVSEYPPGMRPTRRQFLSRNRLVAALGRATVVVEAGVRSGAANTAAWADALGRIVGAVPGPITSASSVGCHALIAGGDKVITRAADIVELIGRMGEFAPELERPVSELDALTGTELAVYEALPRRGGRTVDEIAVTAGLPVTDVLGPLTMLDVRGLVTQVDGCWKLAKR